MRIAFLRQKWLRERALIFLVTYIAYLVENVCIDCWPLVTKFSRLNPAEVFGFFRHLKNLPHTFLRRGSERICPMSQLCRHVKEPSTSVNYECASKIPCIVPSFAGRVLSWLCGAWRLWRWMTRTHWGQGYNRPTGCSAEKAPHATFTFFCIDNNQELFIQDRFNITCPFLLKFTKQGRTRYMTELTFTHLPPPRLL